MTTATVTIGRNVGPEPMSDADWSTYRLDVGAILRNAASEVWVDTDYRGSWGGQVEDAHVWLVALDVDPDTVASALAPVARRYRQDAIGWSVGESTLIGGDLYVP